jgi:hypothetical protein
MAMRGFSFLPRVSIPEAIKGLAIGNVAQYLANRFNASYLQELDWRLLCGFGLLCCIWRD